MRGTCKNGELKSAILVSWLKRNSSISNAERISYWKPCAKRTSLKGSVGLKTDTSWTPWQSILVGGQSLETWTTPLRPTSCCLKPFLTMENIKWSCKDLPSMLSKETMKQCRNFSIRKRSWLKRIASSCLSIETWKRSFSKWLTLMSISWCDSIWEIANWFLMLFQRSHRRPKMDWKHSNFNTQNSWRTKEQECKMSQVWSSRWCRKD